MKYISIKSVLYRILKHPLLKDITYDDVALYASDFIRKLGAPLSYEDKQAVIEIESYRSQLPCDLLYVKQIRGSLGSSYVALRHNTTTFTDNCQVTGAAGASSNASTDYTYTINGDVIYTSFEEGSLEIAYKAVKVDDEGYPMIPDNASVIKAFEYYIRWQTFEILADLNPSYTHSRNNAEKQYTWYMGQADTSMRMLSIDEMESAFAGINRILRKDSFHATFFNDFQQPENFNVNGD